MIYFHELWCSLGRITISMVKIHFFMKSSLLRCVSLLLFENVLNCVAPAVQFKFSCSYFYQKANFTQMQLLSWFDFCFLSFLLFLFLSQSLLKNTVFVNFSYWCCRIMSQAVMLYINLSQVDRFCLFRTLLILT